VRRAENPAGVRWPLALKRSDFLDFFDGPPLRCGALRFVFVRSTLDQDKNEQSIKRKTEQNLGYCDQFRIRFLNIL
jgi:hypothetical protein